MNLIIVISVRLLYLNYIYTIILKKIKFYLKIVKKTLTNFTKNSAKNLTTNKLYTYI